MIPVAFQFARRSNVSPSTFLMPMAFGALLGGLMTQVGTSPNIVVSRIRGEMVGEPFTMFDFTPVGAVLSAVGLVYLVLFIGSFRSALAKMFRWMKQSRSRIMLPKHVSPKLRR